MFNEICINEEMLPKYTYTYIYIYIYIYIYTLIFKKKQKKTDLYDLNSVENEE